MGMKALNASWYFTCFCSGGGGGEDEPVQPVHGSVTCSPECVCHAYRQHACNTLCTLHIAHRTAHCTPHRTLHNAHNYHWNIFSLRQPTDRMPAHGTIRKMTLRIAFQNCPVPQISRKISVVVDLKGSSNTRLCSGKVAHPQGPNVLFRHRKL